MEGNSTNTLRSYKNKLDNNLTGVMPDSWEGHARIAIRESDVVPAEKEESIIEKANKVANKKDVKPERAANAFIKKLAERQE